MDELDRLLAETMHGAADRAPGDRGLLSGVHGRARRNRRRRRAATALAASAAVLAIGVPAALALSRGPDGTVPAVDVPTTLVVVSPATSRPASPAAAGLRLQQGFTAPAFPYTLPATDGMRAPVASMSGGNLVAFFEAIDIRHHSDTTVTVSSRRPTFTGAATETPRQVRGHSGTLRTVDVKPAKQLVLYWPESADRWMALATDDTYTPAQVVALAESLAAASIAVSPPFTLDLSPAGLAPDTVSPSTMSFGGGSFRAVLHKHRALAGANRTVGKYQAKLTRDGAGATLDVDVTDWNATLRVSVASSAGISDADLLRFAAGVHILNRSEPADW